MCHYITLIAPTDNAAALRAIMKRYGRTAQPYSNPSIKKALREGEHQYLTTRTGCDCGTVLAPHQESPEAADERLTRNIARLKKKGWSEAKIARAIDDNHKAEARPSRRGLDSLDLWDDVLHDLHEDLKLASVGLLLRMYSGSLENEIFDASRCQVDSSLPWRDALAAMKEDEVTVFTTELRT